MMLYSVLFDILVASLPTAHIIFICIKILYSKENSLFFKSLHNISYDRHSAIVFT